MAGLGGRDEFCPEVSHTVRDTLRPENPYRPEVTIDPAT